MGTMGIMGSMCIMGSVCIRLSSVFVNCRRLSIMVVTVCRHCMTMVILLVAMGASCHMSMAGLMLFLRMARMGNYPIITVNRVVMRKSWIFVQNKTANGRGGRRDLTPAEAVLAAHQSRAL
jgi:hypothetical protein